MLPLPSGQITEAVVRYIEPCSCGISWGSTFWPSAVARVLCFKNGINRIRHTFDEGPARVA